MFKTKKELERAIAEESWFLPKAWRKWSIECGMKDEEIDVAEIQFRNYWAPLIIVDVENNKKNWLREWHAWCMKAHLRDHLADHLMMDSINQLKIAAYDLKKQLIEIKGLYNMLHVWCIDRRNLFTVEHVVFNEIQDIKAAIQEIQEDRKKGFNQ
jgi:hypothetical protein